MLAGDLNDEATAATTQILQGPPGSEIGTAGYARPDNGDGQRLWNLAPLIPPDQATSREYRGRPELIDHLLVSRALLSTAPSVTTMFPAGMTMPSINDQPTELRNLPGSDHAAVLATLNL